MNSTALRQLQYVWNKRRVFAIALSSLFCLVTVGRYSWLAVGPGSWGPRFACTESYFDCGRIPADRAVEHEFLISNTGWRPLHIEAVAGCGSCSTVKLSKDELRRAMRRFSGLCSMCAA